MNQGYRRGGSSLSGRDVDPIPTAQQKPRHCRMFRACPWARAGLSAPEPGLSKGNGLQTGGHCPTQLILQLPPHLGHSVVLDQPGRVYVVEGVCPPVARGDSHSTGCSLQCPDGDPGASPTNRPGWGLGGQSRLWLPTTRRAECVSSLASRREWKSALSPPLSVATHISFLS